MTVEEVLQAVREGRLYQFDCGLTCRTGPRIVDMAELLFETLYNVGRDEQTVRKYIKTKEREDHRLG